MQAALLTGVSALAVAPAGGLAREPLPEVAVELVVEGFNAPVFLVAPEDGSGRLLVGEQADHVHVITADGERLATPFVDLDHADIGR